MLALARVLAVPPKLLVVDELSLGLAPRVVDDVYRALREIRDAGTSLLVIEQQLPRALELAEQLVVLRKGQVVEAGPVGKLGDLARELLSGCAWCRAPEASAAGRHACRSSRARAACRSSSCPRASARAGRGPSRPHRASTTVLVGLKMS